jgi:hypothetical protein
MDVFASKRSLTAPSPSAKKLAKKDMVKVHKARLLRAVGHLFVGDDDEIEACLGKPYQDLGSLAPYLPKDESLSLYVEGKNLQGTLSAWPAVTGEEAWLRAAFVKSSWLFANLFLKPSLNPDFNKALLVGQRMAETLRYISEALKTRALDLAHVLGITDFKLDEEPESESESESDSEA